MLFIRCSLFVLATLFLTAHPTSAQETPLPDIQGVRSFNSGNYKVAIRELRSALKKAPVKNDARVWNILGMAYYESENFKEAIKAYAEAKKIVPSNPTYRTNLASAQLRNGLFIEARSEIDSILESHPIFRDALFLRGIFGLAEGDLAIVEKHAAKLIDHHPTHSAGYDLMHQVELAKIKTKGSAKARLDEIGEKLKEAKAWSDKGLTTVKDDDSRARLKALSDELGVVVEYIEKNPSTKEEYNSTPDGSDENRTPMKVISRPLAGYSDRARRARKSGTITLLVMFSHSGQIGFVLPLSSIGYGLDDEAVAAAKRIKFIPPTVNGQPVTVFRRVVYSFTVY